MSDQSAELCSDADVVLQLEIKAQKKTLTLAGLDLPMPGAAAAAPVAPPAAPAGPLGDIMGGPAQGVTTQPAPVTAAAPAPAANSEPEPGERFFYTQLDDKWFRKVRGFGVLPEETLDIHSGKGLREILRRAGYPV